MDKKILMKIGQALRTAEIAVEEMKNAVPFDEKDPETVEFADELAIVDGALVDFDRYLSSFSLPKYKQ